MKNFLDSVAEISFDYTDDNGVTFVDAYAINPDEEGKTLGYIIGNEFYPKYNDVLTHQETMSRIKEYISEK